MKIRYLLFLLFIQNLLHAQIFTAISDSPFENVRRGDVEFADVDNDGDDDVLIVGMNTGFDHVARLYINEGNAKYTLQDDSVFIGTVAGDISSADVDNDGDIDVLVTGALRTGGVSTNLYMNDGFGNFTKDTKNNFEQITMSSTAFGDMDGDGDPDLIMMGQNQDQESSTSLYFNDGNGVFELRSSTTIVDGSSGGVVF